MPQGASGADADLRQFDRKTFDHAAETGLRARRLARARRHHLLRVPQGAQLPDGEAGLPDVPPGPAQGRRCGKECTTCHTTAARLQAHARALRPRAGALRAHRLPTSAWRCEKCHKDSLFRGGCGSTRMLQLPPVAAPPDLSGRRARRATPPSAGRPPCRASTTRRRVSRSSAPTAPSRARTATSSGVQTPLRSDRCTACHTNVHRESIKDDCRACHTEETFHKARFDHRERTRFPLDAKHAPLACRKCHTTLPAEGLARTSKTVMDFSGLNRACVSCHKDQHKGEFGLACDACHRPATFKAAGFAHPRMPEFFGGRHQGVTCVKCHVRPSGQPAAAGVRSTPRRSRAAAAARLRPRLRAPSCHNDVHLGQVGTTCERCHTVEAERFAPARFSHDAASPFVLTGKHTTSAVREVPPEGNGRLPRRRRRTAARLHPVQTDCAACHKDPHLGQVDPGCSRCHTPRRVRGRLPSRTPASSTCSASATTGPSLAPGATSARRGSSPPAPAPRCGSQVARTCLGCHP